MTAPTPSAAEVMREAAARVAEEQAADVSPSQETWNPQMYSLALRIAAKIRALPLPVESGPRAAGGLLEVRGERAADRRPRRRCDDPNAGLPRLLGDRRITMKRSEVERVARELHRLAGYDAKSWGHSCAALGIGDWQRLARWHLREVRRARGRTKGYVTLQSGGWLSFDEDEKSAPRPWKTMKDALYHTPSNHTLARVVVDRPKRRKPKCSTPR